METFKEKLVDLVCRIVDEHIEVRFESMSKPANKVGVNNISKNRSIKKDIESYIGQLYIDVSKNIIDEEREEIYQKVNSELEDTVNSLFSEEEAKEIIIFSQTSLGRKIIRNLDLVRDTIDESMNYIDLLKQNEWRSEETQSKIRDIIDRMQE